MIRWEVVRRALSGMVGALLLMIAGAWLLASYLEVRRPELETVLESVGDRLFWAFMACAILHGLLRSPDDRAKAAANDLPPPWSGTIVVVLTGLAAAFFVARGAAGGTWVLAGLLVLGTIALGGVVWRFAAGHAAEIGEARFTRDRPPV